MTELHQWLESNGLGQYVKRFADRGVEYENLASLKEQDLNELGLCLSDRVKFRNAIPALHPKFRTSNFSTQAKTPVRTSGVEKRHLTVLICDLVGSTALSTQLQLEDLREVLHQFQQCCGDAIREHDGHIARFMGDAVLAYFGFPIAHEDDAERAANTALDIVHSVSTLIMPGAPQLQVRIGISSGVVVVGDLIGEGSSSEFALVGEAPNLAARLQAFAEPNQILVGPATRQLLGSLFELADLGNHLIKGFDQPIHIWRIVQSRAVANRFEGRRFSPLTPLVGRETQVALLERQYEKAKRGAGQIVLISGEAGIGKSRSIIEFQHTLLRQAPPVMSFQCSAFHASSPWYPIIRYLESAAGITRHMPSGAKLEKLEVLVHQRTAPHSIVPALASILSIPPTDRYPPRELTPQQQKSESFAAILDLIESYAIDSSAILIFEDVHWADPTSLELLERIRDRVQNLRILLILSFRPDLALKWEPREDIILVQLDRLDRSEVTSMVKSLAGSTALPEPILHEIIDKAEGVPLFVEEITKSILEPVGTRSELQASLTVPDTLHDSLMARLDQVAPMKVVAQVAAVIGREFSFELLKDVIAVSEADMQAALDGLLASGLVFQSKHLGDDTFVFKHALLRDEAYASLLRDERQELHLRVAHTLSTNFPEVLATSPEVVAFHYTHGGELQIAIKHWLKAGQQACGRSAFVEASTHFRTALKLLSSLPRTEECDLTELQLQQSLGIALAAAKGSGASETNQAFRRALDLCKQFKGWPQTFEVLNGIIGFHLVRGEIEQSRDLAEQLLSQANQRDDSTAKLIGFRSLGMSLLLIGELKAARKNLQSSLELYNAAYHGPLTLSFSQDFKATAQAHLALASVLLGDIRRGLALGADAVSHAEHLRHPHSTCHALAFLAGTYVLCRDPQAALPTAERTVTLAHEYGFPLWLAGGRMLRGSALFDLGEPERGLEDIRRSAEELQATGALMWVPFAQYLLAQALLKAKELDAAREVVEKALIMVAGTSGRWYEAELHRLRGDILARGNSRDAAEACYERAFDIALRQHARLWQVRILNALALLFRGRKRFPEIRARLASLVATFNGEDNGADLRQARNLLAGSI